jgi:CHAD domain-containing protein
MLGAPATFTARQQDAAAAIAALTDLGLEFEPPHTAVRTLLDTFDGRIHGAGLRLELRESGGVEPGEGGGFELVVSGPDAVPAHLGVASVPRFAADLPPGPFRARLAAIVEVRALLPIIRVTATQRRGMWRDRADKTVTTAVLHEDVHVDDGHTIDLPAWMLEIDELPGYARRAERARDMLERIGLERLDGDVLTIAARASGVDLAGFTESPTVPLDHTMPAVDGFRAVLANLADTIVANWQGTVDQVDPEFLHDLRVAVRRTRSVVSQGKKVLPPATVEQARERFGWLADLTGPARDLDVYLIEWDGYTRPLGPELVASLDPVRLLLEQRHAAAYATLITALRSPEANEWMSTWRTWLREPIPAEAEHGVHADQPLGMVVRKRIARTQTQLVDDGRLIRSDTPAEQVHDLRKDAKKLRYLFECFASLLPKAPRKRFIRRLKAFQDNLGEHQDSDVHIAVLRDISRELYAARVSPDTMVAIGQLSERLDQRRIAARVEFTERFADYDTKATRRALAAALDGLT